MAEASSGTARTARAARVSLLGIVVAACGVLGPQAGQDDPSAPTLITVRVVRVGGAPVPGLRVEMQVFDDANAVYGQPGSIVHHTYTTDLDGAFDVHLEPTPQHRTFARTHGGVVMFQMFATMGDRYYPWGTMRELGSDAWAGESFPMDLVQGDLNASFPILAET